MKDKYIYNKEESFEDNLKLAVKYMYSIYNEEECYLDEDFKNIDYTITEFLGYSNESYISDSDIGDFENVEIINREIVDNNEHMILEISMDYTRELKYMKLFEKDSKFYLKNQKKIKKVFFNSKK